MPMLQNIPLYYAARDNTQLCESDGGACSIINVLPSDSQTQYKQTKRTP